MLIMILCFTVVVPSKGYAKTNTDIDIGEEVSNISIDSKFQYYTLTLKSKMKVKISVTVEAVEEKVTEETVTNEDYFEEDYFDYYLDDFEYDENYIDFDIDGEYYDTIVSDWKIKPGETKTKTVTLDAGTYNIGIYGYSDGLNYSFNTEDVTIYAKKISMVDKLSLVAGDSKKISVKSTEKGKYVGEIIWTSSNKKVAKVDSLGNVTGVKQGSCIISAKTKNSNIVKCKVTIKSRPQLYVTEAGFDINFLGGIEPYITFQNNFGKTIKYVYFNTYYYNRVGDPAYCEIQRTNYQRLMITGPIKNSETDKYSWDAVIYNNATGKVYIKSAEIQFMDGTKKTISIKKSYE